jgi:hypothetical protein
MLGSHEPRENIDAACGDGEIVEAAAIPMPAILQHAHAPSLGTVCWR